MLLSITKPNIIIQGASRGIGYALVKLALESFPEASVTATARNAVRNDELLALKSDYPQLYLLDLDLESAYSIENAAKHLTQKIEAIHLVVNVSGLLHDENRGIQPEKRISDLEFEATQSVFATNVIGPSYFLARLSPLFKHRDPLVIASITARVGSISDNRLGGWYSYRASKAAMNMMTKNLAIELGRSHKNSAVVSLHPGTTDTDLSKPFQANVKPEKLFGTERSAKQLWDIVLALQTKDNGRFIAWDGSDIEW